MHYSPSWPGLTQAIHATDVAGARREEGLPTGRSSHEQSGGDPAWMAGTSPAMTGEMRRSRSKRCGGGNEETGLRRRDIEEAAARVAEAWRRAEGGEAVDAEDNVNAFVIEWAAQALS